MRDPFETFWETLDDEQKAQLVEAGKQRAPFSPKVPFAQSCTLPDALPWPAKEIEARLQLNVSLTTQMACSLANFTISRPPNIRNISTIIRDD